MRRPPPMNAASSLLSALAFACLTASSLAATFTVSNADNTGAGSLRQAITDAATAAEADIINFAPSLSGATIVLSSGEIAIAASQDLDINASALSAGITIRGDDQDRLFYINAGAKVQFNRVTLTRGGSDGETAPGYGGAIENEGTLSLTNCTLRDNFASDAGGAIDNYQGTVTLTGCTLDNNFTTQFGNGGAIDNYDGTLTLTNCTLTANSCGDLGGAIYNEGAAALFVTHCTITGNFAAPERGGAIASDAEAGTQVTVVNSILAGNGSSDIDYDEAGANPVTSSGANLIGTGVAVPAFPTPANTTGLTLAELHLAELGSYGGPTQTMLPLPGSPALDSAVGSIATDQRGFPRNLDGDLNTSPGDDIGAAESAVSVVHVADDELDMPAGANDVSLREAIRDTAEGGIITFTTGLQPIVLGSELALSSSVLIHAGDLSAKVTIDAGSGPNRIFNITSGGIYLNHLILTGGASADFGGAVAVDGGALSMIDCVLEANTADASGGAIDVSNGSALVDDCVLSGNTSAAFGGAVSVRRSTVELNRCTVANNQADNGGGVHNFGSGAESTLTLTDCTLSGNTATNSGGAFENTTGDSSATLVLDTCTLTGNSAGLEAGGGLNVTYGSAISASLTLVHCTVVGNTALGLGGGILNRQLSGAAEMRLFSCVIAGNSAAGGRDVWRESGTLTSATINFIGVGEDSNFTWIPDDVVGTFAAPLDPLLAPLGNYGGPTQTMPPLVGSPVVDAGLDSGSTADQRGFDRPLDGDGNSFAIPDLGAVESVVLEVTALADQFDSPVGAERSLREAIRDAQPGALITFAANLTGTFTLTRGEIVLDKDLLIDGGYGRVIDGGTGANRIFTLKDEATACLAGLRLTGGNGGSIYSNGAGGAILNPTGSTLHLARCTLSGNQATAGALPAGYGGAIFNQGVMTLSQCTLSGNTAPMHGGAILSDVGASAVLQQCTLSANTSGTYGGALEFLSPATLQFCTLSDNNATTSGGGIGLLGSAAQVTLSYCIIAENDGGSPSDVFNSGGALTREGINLIQAFSGGGDSGPAAITAAPVLAPLGSYGGPTQTMPPLAGSSAVDPVGGLTLAPFLSDQRGFARMVGGIVDIGAAEAGPTDGPGTLAFPGPLVRVPESSSPALIPIARTGGIIGTVTVRVISTPGSATSPADFGALDSPGFEVTFATGETVKNVPVSIVSDATLKEPHENFTLTLSNPGGGAGLGTQTSTVVRIVDAYDAAAPTLTLTTPKASALILEADGPNVLVSGAAKDDKGLQAVQVQLNGGPFVDANLTTAPVNHLVLSSPYELNITAIPGVNNLVVRSFDEKGKISALQKRSFTYRVVRELKVAVDGPSNSGGVSTGFVPTSQRYAGVSYKITATPKAGFVFDGWTANSFAGTGVTDRAAELPALSFIMQPDLELTAHFIANPFTPTVIGTYTGVVLPAPNSPDADGTTPANSTIGLLSLSVTNTGKFTGSLKIDGLSLPVTGLFDNAGVGRFGPARDYTLKVVRKNLPTIDLGLELAMDGGGTVFGIVFQSVGEEVKAVSYTLADRTYYSAKRKVSTTIVSGASQRFNLHFLPYYPQYNSLTKAQYPQGVGIGSIILSNTGTAAFAGTLADNTTFTASYPLTKNDQCHFFASLYSSKGCLGGVVTIDVTQSESDATSTGFLWCRPAQPKLQWYPGGWPEGVFLDFVGSKYIVPPTSANTSVIPGLGPIDNTNGNLLLTAMDGLLSSDFEFKANVSPKNAVTKISPNFTLNLTTSSGEISGTFLHQDGKKSAFKASVFQKAGASRGTYGFFLTAPTAPINGQGQGGAVMLMPR